MSVSYTIISKFYGLLDTIYFKQNQSNPRFILLNKVNNNNSKLLEIAVGTAENSILIAKKEPQINIVGIDLSEDMLKIAQKNIEKENIGNITLQRMDGTNMTFDNGTFDFIVISLLLHELPEKIANKILNECSKVLKPDGKLLVLEWEKPKKAIQKIKFSIISVLEQIANREYNQFMKKDLEKYFSNNGFKIKTVEYGDYSKIIELVKS